MHEAQCSGLTKKMQGSQKLIALRKSESILTEGEFFPLLAEHDKVFAYKRVCREGEILVLANFFGEEVDIRCKETDAFSNGLCLISNYKISLSSIDITRLRPYEAMMLKI